jgi:hypothetical protein
VTWISVGGAIPRSSDLFDDFVFRDLRAQQYLQLNDLRRALQRRPWYPVENRGALEKQETVPKMGDLRERGPLKLRLGLWRHCVEAGIGKFYGNILIPVGRLLESPPCEPVIDSLGEEHKDAKDCQADAEQQVSLAQQRDRAGHEDNEPKHFDGESDAPAAMLSAITLECLDQEIGRELYRRFRHVDVPLCPWQAAALPPGNISAIVWKYSRPRNILQLAAAGVYRAGLRRLL